MTTHDATRPSTETTPDYAAQLAEFSPQKTEHFPAPEHSLLNAVDDSALHHFKQGAKSTLKIVNGFLCRAFGN